MEDEKLEVEDEKLERVSRWLTDYRLGGMPNVGTDDLLDALQVFSDRLTIAEEELRGQVRIGREVLCWKIREQRRAEVLYNAACQIVEILGKLDRPCFDILTEAIKLADVLGKG